MIIKNIRPAISSICNMNCRYCSNSNKAGYARMEDFRRSPLSSGVLSTDQWLQIFKCFYNAGFKGISLTGGEPTLNPDWLFMLKYCKDLGYVSTEITSNLLALDKYREQLSNVKYITKFKVSLDTFNKEKFHYLTTVDALDTVLSNINFLVGLKFNVHLNRVTMRSTQEELIEYLEHASKLNVGVNLLDLVYYKGSKSDNNVNEWVSEFVPAEFTWLYLKNHLKDFGNLELDKRYGWKTVYKKMNIILKNSKLTKRSQRCESCPLYCQEGIFTVRIASDGTISTCPDYKNELPYIDGVKALKDGSLTEKLINIFNEFKIKEAYHFDDYVRKL
jgi:molybdenum cofactor biosynthesis enzyme MoaA